MSKPSRRSGPRDEARADTKPAPEDVASLIKERKKYADWLAALDAKREQTPANVFTRVHADYEERLRAVVAKLEVHRGTLAEQQAGLHKKLEGLEEEIGRHEEQRAEIELRAHVGELGAAALTEALRSADTELERLTVARAAIEADLARVNDFFAATSGEATAPRTSGPVSRKGSGGFDELSFLQSVVGATEQADPDAAEAKATEAIVPVPKAVESEPKPVERKPVEAKPVERKPVEAKPVEPKPIEAKPIEAKPVEAKPVEAKPVEAKPVEAKPAEVKATPAQPTPARQRPTFELERQDEVKLSPTPRKTAPTARSSEPEPVAETLVEKAVELTPVPPPRASIAMQMAAMTIEPPVEPNPSGIIKANESAPSLLEGIMPGSDAGEKPFAANVASNNPLSLKSAGTGDTKTLKCRECGAMNDPSEWYCERCGAELSAM